VLTVALPMYRSKKIGWLALESLCRQVDAPEWELLICEEQEPEMFGMEELTKYKESLGYAECTRITYIVLQWWVPLSQKWKILAVNADSYS